MAVIAAALHYLALALGFTGLFNRWLELSKLRREPGPLSRLFLGDNLWGIAALMWIATGIWRVFGGIEKGSGYYLHNHWFYAKMGVFVFIFLIEIWPMTTFIKWRMRRKSATTAADQRVLMIFHRLNTLQLCLLITIPFYASTMARYAGVVSHAPVIENSP